MYEERDAFANEILGFDEGSNTYLACDGEYW